MSQIEETLGGLRVIKAFNAEAKIQDRFEKSNETFSAVDEPHLPPPAEGASYERVLGDSHDRDRAVVWRYADPEQ